MKITKAKIFFQDRKTGAVIAFLARRIEKECFENECVICMKGNGGIEISMVLTVK